MTTRWARDGAAFVRLWEWDGRGFVRLWEWDGRGRALTWVTFLPSIHAIDANVEGTRTGEGEEVPQEDLGGRTTGRLFVLDETVIRFARPVAQRETVVNVLTTRKEQFVTRGVQPVAFLQDLPQTVSVPAGESRALVLEVDFEARDGMNHRTSFVQSWEDLDPATDYTFAGDAPAFAFVEGRRVVVTFSNSTGGDLDATLTQVRGEPFRTSGIQDITPTRPASIALYGERPLFYPGDLVTDLEELRDHLGELVRIHAQEDPAAGFAQWELHVNARAVPALLEADVSDVVDFRGFSPLVAAEPVYWFVEEVEHIIRNRGQEHVVILRISAAERSMPSL